MLYPVPSKRRHHREIWTHFFLFYHILTDAGTHVIIQSLVDANHMSSLKYIYSKMGLLF